MPKGVAVRKRTSKQCDPTDVYVGQQIRRFRLASGKSQTVLAEALELTFQQVQKYEKGTNRIAPSRLQRVAELLDRKVSEFFPPAGKVSPIDDPVHQLSQTRDGIKLARAFLSIDDSIAQDAIVGMVEAFATALNLRGR
jgi:transcriptional regulator with XRE-family HTH domain